MVSELDRCRPWIEGALAYSGGTHEWEDVVEGVRSGLMQLWPAPRGCLVTEIVRYPRRRVVNVFLAGGEMDQLLDMDGDLVRWARAQGCSAVALTGRKGWERALRPLGWMPQHVTVVKEIG